VTQARKTTQDHPLTTAIVKALLRAHHWRGMLESNDFEIVRDLARAENINKAYLGRVLRLTLLSRAISDALLLVLFSVFLGSLTVSRQRRC
jgi:hypothetical protein